MRGLAAHHIRTVLCMGAHADDIEIGCGGTLLTLAASRPDIRFYWIVFSSDSEREREAREAADCFLGGALADVRVFDFPDGRFPQNEVRIKERMQAIRQEISPDVIFTHRRKDAHQDHRVLAELTWQVFRDNWVLEYEIPKFEGDLGNPDLFVPLSSEALERKVTLLGECFPSQHTKPWYRPETFRGLAALRGLECRSDSGFAEGFHARKTVVRFGQERAESAPARDTRRAIQPRRGTSRSPQSGIT